MTGIQGATGVQGIQGATGTTGSPGGISFYFTFNTNTGPAAPAGQVLFNSNSNPALINNLYISDQDTYGNNVGQVVSNLSPKGVIVAYSASNPSNFFIFSTFANSYLSPTYTVSTDGSGTGNFFSNGELIVLTFMNQGPLGTTGVQGATGTAGGSTGVQGPVGETGVQGVTGVNGGFVAQGFTGVAGATGVQGIQGITGIIGQVENSELAPGLQLLTSILTPVSGAITVNVSNANAFYVSIGSSTTLTVNLENFIDGQVAMLTINANGFSVPVVFSPTAKWPGASQPAQSSGVDVYTIFYNAATGFYYIVPAQSFG